MFNNYSMINTPIPSKKWSDLDMTEKIRSIKIVLKEAIPDISDTIEIISAKKDGQVICVLKQKLAASERGMFLLDVEEILKKNIDNGINLWLEPLGDKNSLRNLRGIEVKNV